MTNVDDTKLDCYYNKPKDFAQRRLQYYFQLVNTLPFCYGPSIEELGLYNSFKKAQILKKLFETVSIVKKVTPRVYQFKHSHNQHFPTSKQLPIDSTLLRLEEEDFLDYGQYLEVELRNNQKFMCDPSLLTRPNKITSTHWDNNLNTALAFFPEHTFSHEESIAIINKSNNDPMWAYHNKDMIDALSLINILHVCFRGVQTYSHNKNKIAQAALTVYKDYLEEFFIPDFIQNSNRPRVDGINSQNWLEMSFHITQDLPYKIGVTPHDHDACCATKAHILSDLLQIAGIETRPITCTFNYTDQEFLHDCIFSYTPPNIQGGHIFVEAKLDEKWKRLDPTWQKSLHKSGFPVASLSNNRIAFNRATIDDPESSQKLAIAWNGSAKRFSYIESDLLYIYLSNMRIQSQHQNNISEWLSANMTNPQANSQKANAKGHFPS